MTDVDRAGYVEDATKFVHLMLEARQWDALDKLSVQNWLDNFPAQCRYFSLRILRHLLYYSERDLEALLRETILHSVLGTDIRRRFQLPSKFGQYPSFLHYELCKAMERTALVPLLDGNRPSESSLTVTRTALQALGFKPYSFAFPDKLSEIKTTTCDRLIFVDDNLGTGDQFRTFWTQFEAEPGRSIADFCDTHADWPIYYVVQVGLDQALNDLRGEFPRVHFLAGQIVAPDHGVFQPTSRCWLSEAERIEATAALTEVVQPIGIQLLGYRDFDYAVVLHKNIPDWSLPLLWRGVKGEWTPLVERKNSYE